MIQSNVETLTDIIKGDGEITPVVRIMAEKDRPKILWIFKLTRGIRLKNN